MALPDGSSSLRRLRNKYRLVVINEDTFEEVAAFKLTRWSVYISLSVCFVVLVGLTIVLIAFTPLKLYIPGYGTADKAQQFEKLKLRADSIEHSMMTKQQYIDDIEKVLKGNTVPLDTTTMKVSSNDKSPIPKKKTRKRRR
jgi:hypothetical protein